MNQHDPQTSGQLPARRKRKGADSYRRYYLEDHPILVPVVTLLLGGLCVYATIFSSLMQGSQVGSGPIDPATTNFKIVLGWGVAFVIGIMVLAFIFLLVNSVDALVRRVRYKQAICPRCGLAEVRRYLRFTHVPVEGTYWENITCPQCGNIWYGRR